MAILRINAINIYIIVLLVSFNNFTLLYFLLFYLLDDELAFDY
jgi:hypothetical protein